MVREGGHVGSMALTDRLSVSVLDFVRAAKKRVEEGPRPGVGLHELYNTAALKVIFD